MKIIVCIKQVPKGSSVRMDPEKGTLIRTSGETEMNPHDRHALAAALQIRAQTGGTVSAVSMGTAAAEATLMEALELGADEGLLLTGKEFAGADVLATAYSLSQVVELTPAFDLILCGRQTTDGDTGQTGPELAAFLGIPYLTQVREIRAIYQDTLYVNCLADQEQYTAEITTPCLLTVEKEVSPLRMPTLKGKLEARKKPLRRVSLEMLADQEPLHYGQKGSATNVRRIFSPETAVSTAVQVLDAEQAASVIYEAMVRELGLQGFTGQKGGGL